MCIIPRRPSDSASTYCNVALACQNRAGVGVIVHNTGSSAWTASLSSTCAVTIPVMTMPGSWLTYFPTGAAVTNTVQPYAFYSG